MGGIDWLFPRDGCGAARSRLGFYCNGWWGPAGDAYGQTLVAFEVIAKALAEAGHTLEDVVRTRMYLANAADMDAVGRAHGELFREIRPAATMLAGIEFINPAMLVEIEVDSYKA